MGCMRFVFLVLDVSSEVSLILKALCEITKQQSYTWIDMIIMGGLTVAACV